MLVTSHLPVQTSQMFYSFLKCSCAPTLKKVPPPVATGHGEKEQPKSLKYAYLHFDSGIEENLISFVFQDHELSQHLRNITLLNTDVGHAILNISLLLLYDDLWIHNDPNESTSYETMSTICPLLAIYNSS